MEYVIDIFSRLSVYVCVCVRDSVGERVEKLPGVGACSNLRAQTLLENICAMCMSVCATDATMRPDIADNQPANQPLESVRACVLENTILFIVLDNIF